MMFIAVRYGHYRPFKQDFTYSCMLARRLNVPVFSHETDLRRWAFMTMSLIANVEHMLISRAPLTLTLPFPSTPTGALTRLFGTSLLLYVHYYAARGRPRRLRARSTYADLANVFHGHSLRCSTATLESIANSRRVNCA